MFASACTALMCRFVLRLFTCLLVQHDDRWGHVLFWFTCQGHVLVEDVFFSSSSLSIFHIRI